MNFEDLREEVGFALEGVAIVVPVALLLLLCILVPTVFLVRAGCYSRAEALGLKAEWGMLQGCIVERPDGVKVVIGNYGNAEIGK